MPQLVFLTFFLGLVSGRQMVQLDADLSIRAIRITVGGREAGTLAGPPWRGEIDLGSELLPQEVTAIGTDANGAEVARTSQTINVPSPEADARLSIHTEGDQRIVELRWMHRLHAKPVQTAVLVDGKPIALDANYRAILPRLDPAKTHIIAGEARFSGGLVARHEIVVIGAAYSDSIASELTPVVIEHAKDPAKPGDCFASDGQPLRVSAAEKGKAVVIMVKDPDVFDVMSALWRDNGPNPKWAENPTIRWVSRLTPDTTLRIMWPVMKVYEREGHPAMDIFDATFTVDARETGMLWMVTRGNREMRHAPRMTAEAVAVAGLMAARDGTRRVVVLLLTPGHDDESRHSPAVVRRYLRSIGVPLRVWSIGKIDAATLAAWGEAEDVSSNQKLAAATERLRKDLADQSVVWLAADALHALRATVRPDCGVQLAGQP